MAGEKKAFISYSHHYAEWVRVLHGNLELVFGKESVFLDQLDIGPGRSFLTKLQQEVVQAEYLVLVVAPEALASPWVERELNAFMTSTPGWARQGRIQIVRLVPCDLPPFLGDVQRIDFSKSEAEHYRKGVRELVAGLKGAKTKRGLPAFPKGGKIPDPPNPGLPADLRGRIVATLAPVLRKTMARNALCSTLKLNSGELEDRASAALAVSDALLVATGHDDPVEGALRFLAAVDEAFGTDETVLCEQLASIGEELVQLSPPTDGDSLLSTWRDHVEQGHRALTTHFGKKARFSDLSWVYVDLELGASRGGFQEVGQSRENRRLEDLLALDPADHPWVTRRWVVRGDPGAGKTTLLRHLAHELAKDRSQELVPVFASLPRLVREREELLAHFERVLGVARPVSGLANALEQEGRAGRLVLLLDGLDEVPSELRADVCTLISGLLSRWPDAHVIVTSRPIGYRRPHPSFVEVDVLPFDRERRITFLARWLAKRKGRPETARARKEVEALAEDSVLWDLSGNPLYLTLIAVLLASGTRPERNRSKLYDQVFDLLLAGRHRDPPKALDAREVARKMLRHLALGMTADNRDAEPEETLEARLYRPDADELCRELERIPRWRGSMGEFLADMAERTGILGPHDGDDADWRFWHRSFREALAAEALEERIGTDARALGKHARSVKGDESRWAEPYALLAGRLDKKADGFIRSLVEANPALGLRALATAQGVEPATVRAVLEMSNDPDDRAKVIRGIVEKLGDAERGVRLLDRLRQDTRDGGDLYWIDHALADVAASQDDAAPLAARLRGRIFQHVGEPPEGLVPFVEIPAGRFRMGSPKKETGRFDREGPLHQVSVPAFALAVTPVTNEQFAAFDLTHKWEMLGSLSRDDLRRHPVVNVSWFAAVMFCRWLGARLPTEAEWEYACRAGTRTRYWSGNGDEDLERVGWYFVNSGRRRLPWKTEWDGDKLVGEWACRTHQVGEKPENPWGLHDLHGNVYEWCDDTWHGSYEGAPDDGSAWIDSASEYRVVRGGSWDSTARCARSAFRFGLEPGTRWGHLGFRPARSVTAD